MQKEIFKKNEGMNKSNLSQYFTPSWAASLIVERFFPDLGVGSTVIEPSCGLGAFINAFPKECEAIGIELDSELVKYCRLNTGREIYHGDFNEFVWNKKANYIIGNPPFKTKLVSQFLDKSKSLLVPNGEVGFLLSTHILQTSSTVARFCNDWSIENVVLPRDIYPQLKQSLCFCIFRMDGKQHHIGIALFNETNDVNTLNKEIISLFSDQGRGSLWKRVLDKALIDLGGRAHLNEIYNYVESCRPTKTKWWREAIRRTAREILVPLGDGEYIHPNFQS